MDKNRQIKPKRRRSPIFAIIFTIIITVLIYQSVAGIVRVYKNKREISDLKQIESSLQSEIEDLQYQIEISNTLEFVERVARETYGLVKPREIIYVDVNREKNEFTQFLNGKE